MNKLIEELLTNDSVRDQQSAKRVALANASVESPWIDV